LPNKKKELALSRKYRHGEVRQPGWVGDADARAM